MTRRFAILKISLLLTLSVCTARAFAEDIHIWGKKVDQLFQEPGESDDMFQVRAF